MNKTEWPANKVEMRNVSELVQYANFNGCKSLAEWESLDPMYFYEQ